MAVPIIGLHFDGNVTNTGSDQDVVITTSGTPLFSNTVKQFGTHSARGQSPFGFWLEILTNDGSGADLSSDFTIECFCRVDDTSVFSSNAWNLRREEPNGGSQQRMRFFIPKDSGSLEKWDFQTDFSSGQSNKIDPLTTGDNVWTHLAATYVRSTSTLRSFVAGVLIGTQVLSGSERTILEQADAAIQVINGNRTLGPLIGFIDEWNFWDSPLWTANFTPPTAPAESVQETSFRFRFE